MTDSPYQAYYKIGLFLLIAAFLLLRLGDYATTNTEGRLGMNALEMMETGDYMQVFYLGQPDNYHTQPPLPIWTMVMSFKAFGWNLMALRLPAALAIFFGFYFLFLLVNLYQQSDFAFFTCLILLCVLLGRRC